MFERLKKIVVTRQTFEVALFWGVLTACFIAAVFSAVFSALEDIDVITVAGCVSLSVFFAVLGVVAHKTKNINACYFVMCLVIALLVMPPLFFTCGGFNSGMVFYCQTTMLVLSLCAKKILRAVLVVLSIVVDSAVFMLAWEHPEWCSKVEYGAAITDIVVSFIFMSVFIFAVVSYLLQAYQREKSAKDSLIEQLNYNSAHDVLTGLFNRRYFIDVLNNEIMPNASGFYILMYDVDHFKKINDTYGHPAGDKALASIAKVAKDLFKQAKEISVRYGGEEFIQVIAADSMDEARSRSENFREAVAAIAIEEFPGMDIRISGGLVSCQNSGFANYGKMLSVVDKLLYEAKARGRNRIVC